MVIYYEEDNFIGRTNEIKQITNAIKEPFSNILIYGKRKVGKTTLIKKVLAEQNITSIYFECIKDSEEVNVKLIIQKMKFLKIIDECISLAENTFLSLTNYLNSLGQKIVLVIDEYPYLFADNDSGYINSIFQNIIDSKYKNVSLILSGSHIGMMKGLLTEKCPLFGRFSYVLELKELPYKDTAQFYKNLSFYDKAALYSVFGGSPFVNKFINPKISLKQNIINTFLSFHSPINIYLSNFLYTDCGNFIQTNKVLTCLKNGRKTYSELEQFLDVNKTGNLSKILKPLLEMNLIKYTMPINSQNTKKCGKYEINDNALRFYYTYVEPYKSILSDLSSNIFYDLYIKESIETFISFRFEDIAREFIIGQIKSSKIKNVINVGRYQYNDHVNKINGEFDIALKKVDGSFDIFEVKYFKKPVSLAVVNKEIHQIRNIKDINVSKIGFISINGYENNVNNLDYKFEGKDLY